MYSVSVYCTYTRIQLFFNKGRVDRGKHEDRMKARPLPLQLLSCWIWSRKGTCLLCRLMNTVVSGYARILISTHSNGLSAAPTWWIEMLEKHSLFHFSKLCLGFVTDRTGRRKVFRYENDKNWPWGTNECALHELRVYPICRVLSNSV